MKGSNLSGEISPISLCSGAAKISMQMWCHIISNLVANCQISYDYWLVQSTYFLA